MALLYDTNNPRIVNQNFVTHSRGRESLNVFLVFCSYGSGSRIKLAYTRKIIDAIHSGSLLKAEYKKTEVFGLEIPTAVEGVPSEILDPVNTVSILFFNLLP